MAIDKTNLEIELKCKITEEQYNSLINKYNRLDNISLQTNYYFDTEALDVSKSKSVLRIRQKGNQYKLTSKVKNADGNLESHKYLTNDEAIDMLANGFDASIININYYVKNVCKLDTYRTSFEYKDGKMFFDKSVYGSKVDYEIEFEVSDLTQGKLVFKDFLDENKITYESNISKCKRAYIEAGLIK